MRNRAFARIIVCLAALPLMASFCDSGGGSTPAPTVSTTGGTVVVPEGDTGNANGVVTLVTTDVDFARGIAVDWTLAAGTATADVDYVQASGTATLAAGDTSALTVTVEVIGDLVEEDDEDLTLTISNPRYPGTNGDADVPIFTGIATVTIQITDDDDAGSGLTAGVYATGTSAEGISINTTAVAGLPPLTLLATHQGGISLIDLSVNPPTPLNLANLGVFDPDAQRVGGLLVSPEADGDPAELILFGPLGHSWQSYDSGNGGFGFTSLGGSVFDGNSIGGGDTGPGFVLASGSAVSRYVHTSGSSYTQAGFFATGTAVSAYAHTATGPVLSVEDGQPGTLYITDLTDPMNPATTAVGAMQNDPRRVRCLPPICAVSNFGSDSLTIVTWDGTSATPTIAGNVVVGNGPVGIDLVASGSNVAIVSTGYFDDSYSVTVVDAAGSVVSNTKTAAPTGCTKPGHALAVNDGTGIRIVMSCNGTGSIAIADSTIGN